MSESVHSNAEVHIEESWIMAKDRVDKPPIMRHQLSAKCHQFLLS